MMIVYGAPPSPFVRKVRSVLHEKGLDYKLEYMAPIPKTPELMAKSPLGKIPYFEDGDFCVPDSSVISAYLERVHPEPALYPRDPKTYARALFLEEYADTKMADAMSAVFFQRFVRPNIFQEEPDEAVVQQALQEEIPPVCDFFEAQLEPGASTLLGEFCIADISVVCQAVAMNIVNEPIDGGRWPKLAAYVETVAKRPSIQQAMS